MAPPSIFFFIISKINLNFIFIGFSSKKINICNNFQLKTQLFWGYTQIDYVNLKIFLGKTPSVKKYTMKAKLVSY